ncbi:hypothetical protein JL722_10195 [Aureococcus anophagefferens]|nr:hypothetical protein JL722_10195 [Aureococcus anophagefferens]
MIATLAAALADGAGLLPPRVSPSGQDEARAPFRLTLGAALVRADITQSTRRQRARMRKVRHERFGAASRTRREPSIRPNISRSDSDGAELERFGRDVPNRRPLPTQVLVPSLAYAGSSGARPAPPPRGGRPRGSAPQAPARVAAVPAPAAPARRAPRSGAQGAARGDAEFGPLRDAVEAEERAVAGGGGGWARASRRSGGASRSAWASSSRSAQRHQRRRLLHAAAPQGLRRGRGARGRAGLGPR